MLSRQTQLELVSELERIVSEDLDRLFHDFTLQHLIHPIEGKKSSADKANILLRELHYPSKPGPYTGDMGLDMLQYLVNHFYRHLQRGGGFQAYHIGPTIPFEEEFTEEHKSLCYFLKNDGYIVIGREVRKLLPQEIEEVKTESELVRLLASFGFDLTSEHLSLARRNLQDKLWSSANGQFRNFMESLLIAICQKLNPGTVCKNAAIAIKELGKTGSPPFLSAELNETDDLGCKHPFVIGLWTRLHPEGSHPGLSDEEDATFRFHLTAVFAYYLLKRLQERVGNQFPG
jgi:hypothetical protein